jgi:DNA polymerase-3 subunit epsilon
MALRQIVLDTETTGLNPQKGHRIIEIGAVELINRRLTGNNYHQYINPERKVETGAFNVHGISDDFLKDKPTFKQVVTELIAFIDGAELIIHNAPFDVGFINHELERVKKNWQPLTHCTIIDTLAMARQRHAGQKNNLDALCKRYNVNNSQRDLHGALLDAQILADVYLAMTGGQVSLAFADDRNTRDEARYEIQRNVRNAQKLAVILPNETELAAHEEMLNQIDKSSQGQCLYVKNNSLITSSTI